MKIGILQTGHAPDAMRPQTGDYSDLFERLLAGRGFEFKTWSVVDMDFPAGPSDADGWLLTGSKHGAYEDLPFIAKLEDLVRDIYAANVPMVGVCFGHQLIAQALGGKVEKFKGGWAVGLQDYDFGGTRVALNAWHQDQVVTRPADAEICGTNDFCENAALVYGDKAFTVQAHPEFTNDFVAELAEKRGRGVVPDPLLDEVATKLDRSVDQSRLAGQIETFFKERKLSK